MDRGTMKQSTWTRARWAFALVLLLLSGRPAGAFIERLTPLGDLLEDSDYIFLARTESVSAEKSLAVFQAVEDLKGRTPFRTLRVHLTGDKEKHVPHLLKRIAPQVPVVFFLTRVDKQWLGLGYTEGTWFQIIGRPASETVHWHFTHCEIYLRRTFKGGTSELVQIIREVLAGKRKPPPPNPKEPPGFGPELPPNKPSAEPERRNSSASIRHGGLTPAALDYVNHGGLTPAALDYVNHGGLTPAALDCGHHGGLTPAALDYVNHGGMTHAALSSRADTVGKGDNACAYGGRHPLAVILLPPLAGLLAPLVSLLFPGVLLAVWRQYRLLVYVLLVQSTLVLTQTLLGWWYPSAWWLAPRYWWWPTVILFAVGFLLGTISARRYHDGRASATDASGSVMGSGVQRPVRLEWWALATLLLVGIGWGVWAWQRYGSAWDQMTPLTVGSAVGLLHLAARRTLSSNFPITHWRTGQVILGAMLLCGLGLVWLEEREREAPTPVVPAQVPAAEDWLQYRGGPYRTGRVSDSPAPQRPKVLWRCDLGFGRGRFYVHSTPTVLGDCAYCGVLHEIQGQTRGYLVCVNIAPRLSDTGETLPPGTVLWRFDAEGTLKPIFASATVRAGRLYIGEGYHQDRDCRLLCLEAGSGRLLWQYQTRSHVESTPTLVETRQHGDGANPTVVVGAGEDGLLAVSENLSASDATVAWKIPHWHVDGSPLVMDGTVYCGSLLGDLPTTQTPFIGAFQLSDGRTLWRIESPLPVSASLVWADSKILVPLGTGKINVESATERGGLLALDAATGRRLWYFEQCGPVFSTPAVQAGKAYFGSKDGWLFCLDAETGQIVWRQQLDAAVIACPALAADAVVAVSVRGTVYSFDAATGQLRWRLDDLVSDAPLADVYSSPVLHRGCIYLGVGRKLVCIGEE
jgi:outer membrane protein assembly factor BamB